MRAVILIGLLALMTACSSGAAPIPTVPPVAGPRGAVPTGPPGSQDTEAFAICQEFVRDQFHSPGTAKFGDWNESKVEFLPLGGSYVVTSYVDGPTIRQRYNCRVIPKGNHNWALIELTSTP